MKWVELALEKMKEEGASDREALERVKEFAAFRLENCPLANAELCDSLIEILRNIERMMVELD